MAEYRRNNASRPGCCQPQDMVRPVQPMPRPTPIPAPGPSCQLPCPPEQTCMDPTSAHECTYDRERFPVAMMYVPWQKWCQPYELEHGLKVGTIFPDLNKPFRGIRKGGCLR